MSVCTTAPLSEAYLATGFCAGIIPVAVQQPRSIVACSVVSNSSNNNAADFLTLERGTGSVLVGEDLDGDGIPESVRTLVTVAGLNHGLAVTSTHVYASSSTRVYRWPYNPATKTLLGDQETVIQNMNADGQGGAPFGHTTRTLAIQEAVNELYVSVGSNANVDPDSFRARIRRFKIDDPTLFPFGENEPGASLLFWILVPVRLTVSRVFLFLI